jgi:ABC-type multidrug transport system fused ATPase/permease subunit
MVVVEIVKKYINEKPLQCISFLFVSCAAVIIKVLVSSNLYSKLCDEKSNFKQTLVLICVLWVFIASVQFLRVYMESNLIPDFLEYSRRVMFENYIKNNEFQFDDSKVKKDLQQMLELTRNIRDLVSLGISSFIPTAVLAIGINVFFYVKFPKIGSLLLVGNVINYFILKTQIPKLEKIIADREQDYFKKVSVLDDNFGNLINIYLNNKVEDTIRTNNELEHAYTESYREQEISSTKFITILKTNNYIFALLSIIMLYKTTNSHKEFVNGLLLFTFYLDTLDNIVVDTSYFIKLVVNLKQELETLGAKIKFNDSLLDKENSKTRINSFKGHIKFDKVYFRYRPDLQWVLENFNLDIKPGEKIAFIGQSGSGKTTSMKILLGFYHIEKDKGRLLVDDIDIADISAKDIRRRFNYINQRTLLFNDTIMNNMKYGNSKSTDEIIAMLKKYDLLKIFCNDGSNCLDKMVESDGINISLGMQKVIFLIRGILKDDTDVFIFDEPLTSIDPPTRQSVINMIDKETKGRTVIIITHDKEITSIVDRVVNLQESKD